MNGAREIKMCKIENVPNVLLHREKCFPGTIWMVFNHQKALEENYAVNLVGYLILAVVNDMMSSNFFSTNSKATFACYGRVT